MWIQLHNLDSDGTAVTSLLSVTIDGERHTVDVNQTGTANVTADVGEFLVNSPQFAVTEAQSDE